MKRSVSNRSRSAGVIRCLAYLPKSAKPTGERGADRGAVCRAFFAGLDWVLPLGRVFLFERGMIHLRSGSLSGRRNQRAGTPERCSSAGQSLARSNRWGKHVFKPSEHHK